MTLTDIANSGPQITARPGTKRHLQQTIARTKFLALCHIWARAEMRRHEAKIDSLTSNFLSNTTPAGIA